MPEIPGIRGPHALDVVDNGGEQSPSRMVLEKADRLPDDLCIDLISQIGDTRNSRMLHQHVAKVFSDSLPDKHSQDGDRSKERSRHYEFGGEEKSSG